jgi:hypothetical protein
LRSEPTASFHVLLALAGLSLGAGPASACAYCRPAVNAQVYNRDFLPTLMLLALPLLAIGLIAVAVGCWNKIPRIAHVRKGSRRWKGD